MSIHKASRKNAPTVVAIVAGEPMTIAAGDRVRVNWTRYGTAQGGTTHEEGAADRHPRGFFVALVSASLVDRTGATRGPAIRLDGQANVKRSNVLAVFTADGERAYDAARAAGASHKVAAASVPRDAVIGRWLPLYRANGEPSSQLVSVEATA